MLRNDFYTLQNKIISKVIKVPHIFTEKQKYELYESLETGIKITLTKVEKSAWIVYCYCEVINNSDKIIQLCGNYVKVNNQSTVLYQSEIIPAGETRQEQMSFDATYFVEEPMEYLELAFHGKTFTITFPENEKNG